MPKIGHDQKRNSTERDRSELAHVTCDHRNAGLLCFTHNTGDPGTGGNSGGIDQRFPHSDHDFTAQDVGICGLRCIAAFVGLADVPAGTSLPGRSGVGPRVCPGAGLEPAHLLGCSVDMGRGVFCRVPGIAAAYLA